MQNERVGAVLVVGGGITGIQASLDLAEQGFKVYLLERKPSIGGRMAQLDKTFPTNDCAMCIMSPKLVECGRHPNIELLTYSSLENIDGEAGNFKVRVKKLKRFVNLFRCIGCGECEGVCPIKVKSEFDEGLSKRGAIYRMYPQAIPNVFTIDEEVCIKCFKCSRVCEAKAIDHEMQEEIVEIKVGSIILSNGCERFDARGKPEFGYGRYKNVITSIELERILSASGPFGGHLKRVSDGKPPKRIAFIQCVGSRDKKLGNPYCSTICCTYAIKEALIAKEHSRGGLDIIIFYMDMRTFGKGFEEYFMRARDEFGIRFQRARITEIAEKDETKNLRVRYEDESGAIKVDEFDLVVLSIGLTQVGRDSKIPRIQLNEWGFCSTHPFSPVETSNHGIYVAGTFQSPKDIPESVAQASAAAAKVGEILSQERWKLTRREQYPPERPLHPSMRIGVFICHCGINIANYINIEALVNYTKTLEGVVYCEPNLFSCSQDTQQRIKEIIRGHELNRVVVASCSPRTHESLFQKTLRDAGLNPYLFEMANIRDQCSWVHSKNKKEATEKAKALIRGAVAKVAHQKPLKRIRLSVVKKGLVIGGGLSGITASLSLAKQGFEVYLVEREPELGGNLRGLYYLPDCESPQSFLSSLIKEVEKNQKIHTFTSSEVREVSGYVGNFKTKIEGEKMMEVEHGVIIIATGGVEYKPIGKYLYGEDSRVLTQRELEERIESFKEEPQSVVMIQCVGSRNEERKYCSRYCCSSAIKNALMLKERYPKCEVYILYRDVRTYGFKEEWYRRARERGVIFIRYDEKLKPEVSASNKHLTILVFDSLLKEKLLIGANLLILSTAILPHPQNGKLAEILKIPLTEDGFFLEAHPKLRPLELPSDGLFVCGLSHSPKMIDESISQSLGAASRASTILSKGELEAEGTIAIVNKEKCIACLTCMRVCPYNVPSLNEEGVIEIEPLMCHGCGTCTSECPAKALELQNYLDKGLIAKVEAIIL